MNDVTDFRKTMETGVDRAFSDSFDTVRACNIVKIDIFLRSKHVLCLFNYGEPVSFTSTYKLSFFKGSSLQS